jgi:hypothetical protein
MSITHHATCTPDPCPPRLPLHLFMLHCYHQHLSYVARIDSSQESDRLPSLPLANSQIKLEAWGLLTRSYTLGTLEDGIDMLDSTLPSQLINLSGTLHLDSSPTRGVTRHGVRLRLSGPFNPILVMMEQVATINLENVGYHQFDQALVQSSSSMRISGDWGDLEGHRESAVNITHLRDILV